MVKNDEFDNAIESLRVEIAAIRTSISDKKNTKMENLINDNLEPSSSDDETDSDSDNEFDNEPKKPSKISDYESDNE